MDTNHDFNLPSADSFVSVIAAESTFVVMGQVRTAAVLEKVAGRRGGRSGQGSENSAIVRTVCGTVRCHPKLPTTQLLIIIA
jgi:hypothetical protein